MSMTRPLAVGIAATGILLAGCTAAGQDVTASETTPAAPAPVTPDPQTPEPQPDPDPLPYVEADGEPTCDYILGRPYEFVAVSYLINTGDAPGRAEVIATWKQANGKHIQRSKTVDVPVDKPVEVYLSARATSEQIDLHQSLPMDKRCAFEVNVTP